MRVGNRYIPNERLVHRVHSLIVVRLSNFPILIDQQTFKRLCEECFSESSDKSFSFKMAVVMNTISAKKLPPLELEFIDYIESAIASNRHLELIEDIACFDSLARRYFLDFIEVSRWRYRNFIYDSVPIEGRNRNLIMLTKLKGVSRVFPKLASSQSEKYRFVDSEIETLIGGWWDFRFCIGDDVWWRMKKGKITLDRDFEFLPECL